VPPIHVPQQPQNPRPASPRPSRLQRPVLAPRVVACALLLAALVAGPCGQLARADGAAAGMPAAGDALGEVLAAVAARPHARASFVEHQYLKILKRPLESHGELLFAPPDRLEKRTLAPRPESLRVEAGQLTLERGKRHMSVALASYPQLAPLVEGIRATLAGDRATLERLFVVGFTPGSATGGGASGNEWSLALQPRDAQLARLVRELRIGGRGNDVLRVETLRGDGDRSVMDVTPLGPQ